MDRARDRGLGRGADHYLQLGLHLRCPGRARPRARPARTLSRTGLGRPRMDPERQRSRVIARQSALPRRAGTHPLMEEPVMPASPLHRFFTELRRRRVIRVAIVYAVAGWVIVRSEEHTSELQSLMRISYAVFCLKKKNHKNIRIQVYHNTRSHYESKHE